MDHSSDQAPFASPVRKKEEEERTFIHSFDAVELWGVAKIRQENDSFIQSSTTDNPNPANINFKAKLWRDTTAEEQTTQVINDFDVFITNTSIAISLPGRSCKKCYEVPNFAETIQLFPNHIFITMKESPFTFCRSSSQPDPRVPNLDQTVSRA